MCRIGIAEEENKGEKCGYKYAKKLARGKNEHIKTTQKYRNTTNSISYVRNLTVVANHHVGPIHDPISWVAHSVLVSEEEIFSTSY